MSDKNINGDELSKEFLLNLITSLTLYSNGDLIRKVKNDKELEYIKSLNDLHQLIQLMNFVKKNAPANSGLSTGDIKYFSEYILGAKINFILERLTSLDAVDIDSLDAEDFLYILKHANKKTLIPFLKKYKITNKIYIEKIDDFKEFYEFLVTNCDTNITDSAAILYNEVNGVSARSKLQQRLDENRDYFLLTPTNYSLEIIKNNITCFNYIYLFYGYYYNDDADRDMHRILDYEFKVNEKSKLYKLIKKYGENEMLDTFIKSLHMDDLSMHEYFYHLYWIPAFTHLTDGNLDYFKSIIKIMNDEDSLLSKVLRLQFKNIKEFYYKDSTYLKNYVGKNISMLTFLEIMANIHTGDIEYTLFEELFNIIYKKHFKYRSHRLPKDSAKILYDYMKNVTREKVLKLFSIAATQEVKSGNFFPVVLNALEKVVLIVIRENKMKANNTLVENTEKFDF